MRLLFTLSVALVLFVSASSAHAQNSRSYTDEEVFRQLVTIQMVESLQHPLDMVRSQTLKNAIVYSTLHRDRVDLVTVVSDIARVAREDEAPVNRRLAIAALRSIDSYRAGQHLARLEGMNDGEYRTLVAGVIAEYEENRSRGTM